MPEYGRYKKLPRPESIQKFIEYLDTNEIVSQVKTVSEQIICIERVKYSSLRVFLTNIYIVGLADVHEILAQADPLDAIVTMSLWNSYTSEAKEFCKERRIGLFMFKEFLGAVHYDGNRYLNYIPPDERKKKQ